MAATSCRLGFSTAVGIIVGDPRVELDSTFSILADRSQPEQNKTRFAIICKEKLLDSV